VTDRSREATYPGYALIRQLPSQRRQIFEAIQVSDPWRHVALAIRPPGAAPGDAAAMTEAARQLDHRGIAQLVATHQDATAVAWVAGRGLDRVVARLDDAHRLDLAIQIAGLVAHAHERGVVLRDISPRNLVLDRSDGKFHVTLIDLDLARVEGSPAAPARDAAVRGWNAPEQAVLEPRWIDRRADLYALGATLAFVFTAAPLFSHSAAAVREQLLEDRLAAAPVPDPVRAILRGLVAVDRDARRPAAQIVDALRLLRGEHLGGRTSPSVMSVMTGGIVSPDRASRAGAAHPGAAGARTSPRRSRDTASDEAYAAFRAAIEATARPAPRAAGARLAIARTCLRLGDRDAARSHAQAVCDAHGDDPGALAIAARAALDDDDRSAAIAALDRVASLPPAPDLARDLLAAEIAALRPERALALAHDASDPGALVTLRALCHAWLTELDALAWHARLAWSVTQPGSAAIASAMADTFVRAGGDPDTLPASLAPRAAATLADPPAGTAGVMAATIQAVAAEPRAPATWLHCADRLIAEARPAAALDVLASCDTVCGASPESDRLRATAWLALDELDLAIACGQRALSGGSRDPALWHVLALAWIGSGHGDEAVSAVRVLARAGDAGPRVPVLALYAALATGEMTEHRTTLVDAALAVSGDDPDLALVHSLMLLGAGADAAAERTLSALRARAPDLAPSRSCRLAIRGMTASLADAIEEALDEADSPPRAWAAALYYLAAGHPIIAASYLRHRPNDSPALAAEAFVRCGDRDGLRDLAPHLDDLAERVAQRLR
jgi:tetratricopeptide (TPR) repeat protein